MTENPQSHQSNPDEKPSDFDFFRFMAKELLSSFPYSSPELIETTASFLETTVKAHAEQQSQHQLNQMQRLADAFVQTTTEPKTQLAQAIQNLKDIVGHADPTKLGVASEDIQLATDTIAQGFEDFNHQIDLLSSIENLIKQLADEGFDI